MGKTQDKNRRLVLDELIARCSKNRTNGCFQMAGPTLGLLWECLSVAEIVEGIDGVSVYQGRGALKQLEDAGMVITAAYTNGFVKCKWYAVTPAGLAEAGVDIREYFKKV